MFIEVDILQRIKRNTSKPAFGIFSNKGAKNTETQKNIPANTVLSPVRAPALIPAADSGDIRMGGPP